MAERETTIWVDVDRLVPHPDNPNKMKPETMEKLRANIDSGSNYPPLIVRSLEKSVAFTDLFEQEKLQIIDGEHRFLVLKDLGHKQVEVSVWRNLTDERAWVYLLTLNRLEGDDDPAKRRKLIKSLVDLESGDTAALAAILPETAELLDKVMNEETRAAIGGAHAQVATITQQEPITVFATPEQAEKIRSAMTTWLRENDPGKAIAECREGAALAAICEYFNGPEDT